MKECKECEKEIFNLEIGLRDFCSKNCQKSYRKAYMSNLMKNKRNSNVSKSTEGQSTCLANVSKQNPCKITKKEVQKMFEGVLSPVFDPLLNLPILWVVVIMALIIYRKLLSR